MDAKNFLSNISIALFTQPELDAQLLTVSQAGQTAIVTTLVDARANVNAINQDGNSALILAALHTHTATVSTLIAAGANVNTANLAGNTALISAAFKGQTALIDLLLAKGASINTENLSGITALMLASSHHHRDTAFRLLSAMSFQNVLANQQHAVLGHFATLCIPAVLDAQREVFNILRTVHLTSAFSDINGPVKLLIAHLCPSWYLHRANSDIKLLSRRLMQILDAKKRSSIPPLGTTSIQPAAPTFLPIAQMTGLAISANRNFQKSTVKHSRSAYIHP